MVGDLQEQRILTEELDRACYSYEVLNQEIMTDAEYDRKYNRLQELEGKTKTIFPHSPTQQAGYYQTLSELVKVKHDTPILSLDKTKDIDEISSKFNDAKVVVSYKLDGLTVVLRYNNGTLQQAITRGNGLIGEDVTHTVSKIANLPKEIKYKGEINLRGEAFISYADFDYINSKREPSEQYRNTRNLASGSIRSLDSKVAKERRLKLVIFECLSGLSETDSKSILLTEVESLGFEVVDRIQTTGIKQAINILTNDVTKYAYPVDGLVVTLDSISKSQELGSTDKYPRYSMAFKWQDDTQETTLKGIEWNTSRTGLINPVAVFEPIELEGTTVKRASLHNLDYIRKLQLSVGDRITIYKANMIIPQVAENLTKHTDWKLRVPSKCPTCKAPTSIIKASETNELTCTNHECKARVVGRLTHFTSRDYMNIVGLSGETVNSLYKHLGVRKYQDIYTLQVQDLEYLGKNMAIKLYSAIQDSKTNTLANFIAALGITNIGRGQAKLLTKALGDWTSVYNQAIDNKGFTHIKGIGKQASDSLTEYIQKNKDDLDELLTHLDLETNNTNTETTTTTTTTTTSQSEQRLADKVFVVTGKVHHYKNRRALQDEIEFYGGKVTGSVTSKTDYLINNDSTSTSTKNKQAKELGIPIITEEDFLGLIGI